MTTLEKILTDLGIRPDPDEKARVLQGAKEDQDAARKLAAWLARQR
jgi:hypothetical protein